MYFTTYARLVKENVLVNMITDTAPQIHPVLWGAGSNRVLEIIGVVYPERDSPVALLIQNEGKPECAGLIMTGEYYLRPAESASDRHLRSLVAYQSYCVTPINEHD
jgi:hypothetical protein